MAQLASLDSVVAKKVLQCFSHKKNNSAVVFLPMHDRKRVVTFINCFTEFIKIKLK